MLPHVTRLANEKSIRLIVQRPNHEGFLLRHLAGCERRQPPRGQSFDLLKQEWPTYRKGLNARELSRKLGLEEILRACTVEDQLRDFLARLGFPV